VRAASCGSPRDEHRNERRFTCLRQLSIVIGAQLGQYSEKRSGKGLNDLAPAARAMRMAEEGR